MNNQNTTSLYEQSISPKQYAKHVSDELPTRFHLQYGRTVSASSNEGSKADLDSHWGPEDLSVEQELESAPADTPITTVKDEVAPLHHNLETTKEEVQVSDYETEVPYLTTDEEETEEQYVDDDDDFEETPALELNTENFKEDDLQVAEHVIDENWYENLPEELEASEEDEDFSPATGISKEQRNRQHAYLLAYEYGWTDQVSIDVLVEILEPSGQAVNTINKLRGFMDNEASAEELLLAYHIRELWKESHEFSKYYFSPWEQYRTFIITWSDAMKLVRLYNDLPDIEEIFIFLERLLDNWSTNKNSNILQPFQQYLSEFLKSETLINCPDLLLDF